MKYLAIFIVFILGTLKLQAQTNIPPNYTYKQKRLNDTRKMLFPDLQTSTEIPYNNNMPVLSVRNEAVKVGSNSRGEVCSMQIDNMPLLKPFKIKDEIPNPEKQSKPLIVTPDEKH